jgi:uncharacterized phiE125 gp8 family phage protein
MKTVQTVAPTLLPVTLQEFKDHLRLDSGTFDGDLTLTQCLSYGSHAIANNYTTHVGAWVDVLGKQAEVLLHCGTNGAAGTNDTRIEESDDAVTGTPWTGGAFAQVTTANDNTDYKKAYTGTKQYISTSSKVLLAACEFGTSILVKDAQLTDDALLTDILSAAVDHAEDFTARQLMTATWDMFLNEFPCKDFIEIPYGNLQSVTSVKYKDCDGTETTMTVTTEYLVETNGEARGRIVLPYGCSWPSVTLYPSNPISIRFVCGYTSAAVVPTKIKAAIKLIAADLYNSRQTVTDRQTYESKAADNLLYGKKLWSF